MILDLDEIKLWLKLEVEYVEEDSLLNSLLVYSVEEIKNSTGKLNTDIVNGVAMGEIETYKLIQKLIVCDLYQNRGSQDLTIKTVNILSMLYTKLQYCYPITEVTP